MIDKEKRTKTVLGFKVQDIDDDPTQERTGKKFGSLLLGPESQAAQPRSQARKAAHEEEEEEEDDWAEVELEAALSDLPGEAGGAGDATEQPGGGPCGRQEALLHLRGDEPQGGQEALAAGPRGAGRTSAQGEPADPTPAPDFVLFHCQNCFSVLGDSVHLCRDETGPLDILIFSRITRKVILDKSLLVGIEGALLGSSRYPLFCQSCGLSVGFNLDSSYATFSDLKGLFCLFKKSIFCYLLKTKSIVSASEMEFPFKHLNDHISELVGKIERWTQT
ncbi:uncharacterized protein LOC141491505 [Macrotis lagotis]|uniref:uncharacterized protein LOC141491505 n=1 Tax=Macrotis lagotis TaxID=92651 RepID=UPI003D69A6FB